MYEKGKEEKGRGRKGPHSELGPRIQRRVNEEATARAFHPREARVPLDFPS